jgi:rRNA maturation RNase YbeY
MIEFFSEDIDFELPNTEGVVQWIEKVVQLEKKKLGALNYIFCTDSYLLQLNQKYLDHDTLTDIITFPYNRQPLEGDIFISIDRVRENAIEFGETFERELNRVIIHGVLHLCGYGDKTEEEEKAMREKENTCLNLF